MMKEYWFYLETYVFIWSNSKETLVYNSLSGKGYLYCQSVELKNIITQLEDKSNLYCIAITEEEMQCPAIREFVFSIRESFCGDLLDKSIYKQKPLVIIPELNVNEEGFTGVEAVKRDSVSGIHAVKNLLELTIYLTGTCELDCKDCRQMFKQLIWCNKNEQVLPKEILFEILDQTRYTSINEVKFMGGNVFLYPFWDEIIDELKKYPFRKNFHIDFRLLPTNPKQLEIFESDRFMLTILIDISGFNKQDLKDFFSNHQNCSFLFKIKSIEEYKIAQSIIDQHQITANVMPFFDGKNLRFFKDNVFQDLNDIVNTSWKKNEIFAHTVLNTNHFGKLTIAPNCKIHANVNFEPIGEAKLDNIKVLVNHELKQGKSWLLTRNKITPCEDCLYKYLCPSPSNYEIAIGQNNLCHVRQGK